MKKIFNRAVISIMIICIIMFMMISAFAHPQMLNVQYDECIADPSGDGINEKWYILNSTDLTQHYNHEIATIKYYFESTAENDNPHTENGSYILPNGIIVLAPEDEEAYLAGTLEFRTGEIM